MQDDHIDDHDRGLAFDLETISKQMMARRRALAWFGGAGMTALLAGCGGGSDSSSSSTSSGTSSSSSSSSASSTASSSSSSSSASSSSSSSETCIATPAETPGPYPADGTNTSSGSTSDVLTASGIVRSDVRTSFISSTDDAGGVLCTFTITLVDSADSCTPLEGYAIYFWQVDRSGNYSLYGAPTESYLRGVQVTDANGQVTFITYFPAAYGGRYPHQHFEVFKNLAAATTGKNSILTSQFAMPASICNTVYSDAASLYPSSAKNFASVAESTDLVFSTTTAAQLAQMTPSFSGSVSAGYVETCTVGIAV